MPEPLESGTGFQPVADKPVRTTFQAINPWKSLDVSLRRRNLPHVQVPGATYFVTFRCQAGLTLPPVARDMALSAILHWDRKRIDLDAAVVMPDHAHAVFRIFESRSLEAILHSIKSFSSNRINKALGREGSFWMDESFDHVIRNEDECVEKIEYIRQNPVKRGLVSSPGDYRWLYIRGQV